MILNNNKLSLVLLQIGIYPKNIDQNGFLFIVSFSHFPKSILYHSLSSTSDLLDGLVA